jgi:hypothetical protein
MAQITFDATDFGTARVYGVALVNAKGEFHDDPRHTGIYVMRTEEEREVFLAKFNSPNSLDLRWVPIRDTFLYDPTN